MLTKKKQYPDSLSFPFFLLRDVNRFDSTFRMIRRGFLDRQSRKDLIERARDGSAGHRPARLKAWVTETLPRSARQVGAWIAREFGEAENLRWLSRPGQRRRIRHYPLADLNHQETGLGCADHAHRAPLHPETAHRLSHDPDLGSYKKRQLQTGTPVCHQEALFF